MKNGITLLDITFRNFKSFGNNDTTVKLDLTGTTLVVGQNLDDNPISSGSNGAGKTTILDAIVSCLYNKTPSGISKDKLINRTNNRKDTQMETKIRFQKNEDIYQVVRMRGCKDQSFIYKNDIDVTPDSVTNIDKAIEEIVGISYELFTKVVCFTGSAVSFLELPVSQQRNLIEELLRVTSISEKAVSLKEMIKDTEKSIDIENAILQQKKIQQNTRIKHLDDAQRRMEQWDYQHNKKIQDILSQIEKSKELDSVDFDTEKQSHQLRSELKQKISLKKVAFNSSIKSVDSITKNVSKLTKDIQHLEEAKCPYCLQSYEDAGKKVVEIKKALSEYESNLVLENDNKQSISDEINQLESELKNVVINHENLDDLISLKQDLHAIELQLELIKSENNPYVEPLETLLEEKDIEVDSTKLDELQKRLSHEKFLLKLLTDKNSFIRKKIIGKTIPFLNQRLDKYLSELGLPHIVKFQSDMSCCITQYSRELDHGNLSKGEQKKVNIAMSLAFRDVLFHLHSPINVMFCDEIDSGNLDSNAVDATIRLLKQKARDDNSSIYVISHRPEFEGRMDRTLIVRKENGFSNMIEEMAEN